MRKEDILAPGYREMEHGGFSWLANEEGARFLTRVDDWSPQALAISRRWSFLKKRYHKVYFALDQDGMRYLIKVYSPEKERAYFYGRQANRAKNEFSKTLIAYENDIPTVLPLAVGEWREDRRRGIIIYPFLDKAITLERVYTEEKLSGLGIRERQCLEKTVGRLMRKMVDTGAYPVDAHLDHFLTIRTEEGDIFVYYIDFEKIKFHFSLKRIFKRRGLIKTLGRLLARLEWLRVSGGRVNRPSMMRIGRAYFHQEGSATLDKRLCQLAIQAATKYWHRREFHMRGEFPLSPIRPENFRL